MRGAEIILGFCSEREATDQIIAVAGSQPHAGYAAPGDDAKAGVGC
jgi:hypothetical protein